jgi:hypothetical protein
MGMAKEPPRAVEGDEIVNEWDGSDG